MAQVSAAAATTVLSNASISISNKEEVMALGSGMNY
jgi:hypothetical protein